MRRWSAAEERLIIDCAGWASVSEMASILDRSYTSVARHVQQMRDRGLISKSLRVYGEDRFISDLKECIECGEPRSTCNDDGICKVCRDKEILASHIARMHKSYANLPQELKEQTNGTFELQRVKRLMKTDLEAPKSRISKAWRSSTPTRQWTTTTGPWRRMSSGFCASTSMPPSRGVPSGTARRPSIARKGGCNHVFRTQ